MPTFMNWALADTIPDSVEGQNASELLTIEKHERQRPIYIRGHLQESVITKPYKLIRTRHLNSETELELYNIEEDPSETEDLAGENPEIVNRLLKLLEMEFAKDTQQVNVGLKD